MRPLPHALQPVSTDTPRFYYSENKTSIFTMLLLGPMCQKTNKQTNRNPKPHPPNLCIYSLIISYTSRMHFEYTHSPPLQPLSTPSGTFAFPTPPLLCLYPLNSPWNFIRVMLYTWVWSCLLDYGHPAAATELKRYGSPLPPHQCQLSVKSSSRGVGPRVQVASQVPKSKIAPFLHRRSQWHLLLVVLGVRPSLLHTRQGLRH